MRHLVLFYDKFKTIPHCKIFDEANTMQKFIQQKTTAGIDCYEYSLDHKYSVAQQVIKSTDYKENN